MEPYDTHDRVINGKRFRVAYYSDHHTDAPWVDNPDAHGAIVTSSTENTEHARNLAEVGRSEEAMCWFAMRELVRYERRSGFLYYDVLASVQKAISEWGAEPEEAQQLVESDFNYLHGWYHDKWWYVGIGVTPYDDNGELLDESTLWGIESNASADYIDEVITELATACMVP